jgi:formyl-CoA transferase
VRELSEAGVAAAPVYSNREVMEDPQVQARQSVVRIPDEDFGSVAVPCVVPRLSATPGEARSAGPAPGKHNDEIYGDLLGLSASERDALRNAGVI